MALNTYNLLLAGIEAFLEDDDAELTASVPDIINLGEIRLIRDLDLAIFRRTNSAASFVIGTPTITKPTIAPPDLLVKAKSLWITGGTLTGPKFLLERSHEYLLDYNSGGSNGVPTYFAEVSETQWYVAPAPVAAYVCNVRYISRPAPLAAATQTNWLSTYASDMLFKASLAEAEKFLKADERSVVWEKDYTEALPLARRELYNGMQNQFDRLGATSIAQGPRSLSQ